MGGKKKKSAAATAPVVAPSAAAAAARTGPTENGVAEEPKKQASSNKPTKPVKENKSKGFNNTEMGIYSVTALTWEKERT